MTRMPLSVQSAMCAVGTVLLLASAPRATAADADTAPTCSHWVELAGTDYSARAPADLGCTNRQNLEHMVEDPNDLVRGRHLGPADAARESLAVRNYEDGKVKFAPSGGGSNSVVLAPVSPSQGGQ